MTAACGGLFFFSFFLSNTKPREEVSSSGGITKTSYLLAVAAAAAAAVQSVRREIFTSVLQLRFHSPLPVCVSGSGLPSSVCTAAVHPHGCALEQWAGRHMIPSLLEIAAGDPAGLFLDAYWVRCPHLAAFCFLLLLGFVLFCFFQCFATV